MFFVNGIWLHESKVSDGDIVGKKLKLLLLKYMSLKIELSWTKLALFEKIKISTTGTKQRKDRLFIGLLLNNVKTSDQELDGGDQTCNNRKSLNLVTNQLKWQFLETSDRLDCIAGFKVKDLQSNPPWKCRVSTGHLNKRTQTCCYRETLVRIIG